MVFRQLLSKAVLPNLEKVRARPRRRWAPSVDDRREMCGWRRRAASASDVVVDCTREGIFACLNILLTPL